MARAQKIIEMPKIWMNQTSRRINFFLNLSFSSFNVQKFWRTEIFKCDQQSQGFHDIKFIWNSYFVDLIN